MIIVHNILTFKSLTALAVLAKCTWKTKRRWCEINHRKYESDGIGGHVKSALTQRVQAENIVMRIENEVYDDCLKVLEANHNDGKMKIRNFIIIEKEKVDDRR